MKKVFKKKLQVLAQFARSEGTYFSSARFKSCAMPNGGSLEKISEFHKIS
jgi:hypothetical protein